MDDTTKPAPASQPYSRDELQAMADALTMGDVWRSQKESPDNRAEVGMRAFWHAAQRLELVARDVDFGDFIDRVRSADFKAVNQAVADEGKAPDSAPKPG